MNYPHTEQQSAMAMARLNVLREAYGKIAFMGEPAGWHLVYEHSEPSGSESSTTKQSWQPLTGVCATPEQAIDTAFNQWQANCEAAAKKQEEADGVSV